MWITSSLLAVSLFAGSLQHHEVKASPFDGLRWVGSKSTRTPEVQIGEVWYAPVSIDELEVEAILTFCDKRWPGQRTERFGEDLVEAMAELGWEGDLEVDLVLKRLEDGERVRVEGVEMTFERRDAIRRGNGNPAPRPQALSPFDGLRWKEQTPEVLIEGAWYVPVAVDGIDMRRIRAACEERWPGQFQKRFGEDLIEALMTTGWSGDETVELELSRVGDGAKVELEAVMTKARRNNIRDGVPPIPDLLSPVDARAELDDFARRLRERFAYLGLGEFDLEQRLAALAKSLGDEPVAVTDLARELNRVLMRYPDGHAYVSVPGHRPGEPGDRYLPFLLADSLVGPVAFDRDRRALVNAPAPVVVALDGLPLDDWLSAVEPDVARGSAQLVRRRAMQGLREIDAARRTLGLPTGVPLAVTFRAVDGDEVALNFPVSPSRPTYGTWPKTESVLLSGGIGYLRIPRMDDSVPDLRRSMAEFADARGLIVDVRGNGGGSRELLLALAGYLIGPDEPAVVGNVARYRLAEGFDDDHLEARYMHRADWSGWSDGAQAAVEAAAASFEPEWDPGPGFSEWHYLVMERTGHADEYFFDQPVAILSDAGCFSATDIFLGALELLPRVTLIGSPSSGGSARSQRFRLPRSGIEVGCASMASFRPDGRLYDGRGIEVDVELLPDPSFFTRRGEDVILDAAVKLLTAK